MIVGRDHVTLVGIDASRAVRPTRTGTEVYSLQLLSALLRRPSPLRYRLYLDRAPGPDFPRSDRAELQVIPSPRLWTHLRLGLEIRRHRPDALFVPAHVIPIGCPVPAVVTIHDVGYLWYRSAYTPLAWLLLHLGTIQNVRAACRIVVDSQATARDLIQHFRVPAERIRVAYLGAPPAREVAPDPTVPARYGLPARYFLFVGTLQPRKNLDRLLRAFATLVARQTVPLGLALAGQPGVGTHELRWLAVTLGITERVHWLSYVPSADLAELYAGAVAFVFPSRYEGFGLPVLEAMAQGTPVIASTASSLPEIVGSAGLLVAPDDVTGLAQAMALLLEDRAARERLVTAGRQRLATFSWERCAREVEVALAEASGTDVAGPVD